MFTHLNGTAGPWEWQVIRFQERNCVYNLCWIRRYGLWRPICEFTLIKFKTHFHTFLKIETVPSCK